MYFTDIYINIFEPNYENQISSLLFGSGEAFAKHGYTAKKAIIVEEPTHRVLHRRSAYVS